MWCRVKAVIITRDRPHYAQQCLVSLIWSDGVDEIHVVDHGSTYPPMLAWLKHVCPYFGVVVHRLPNAHPRDLWTNGTLAGIVKPDERFIVTDCDVVAPAQAGDWVNYLGRILDARPDFVKAGLGLRTDNLPGHYAHAKLAQRWEAQYAGLERMHAAPRAGVYYLDSEVDTTMALYRGLEQYRLGPAARTCEQRLMATHLSWYEDTTNPTEEQRYYREHATPGISHWLDPIKYMAG